MLHILTLALIQLDFLSLAKRSFYQQNVFCRSGKLRTMAWHVRNWNNNHLQSHIYFGTFTIFNRYIKTHSTSEYKAALLITICGQKQKRIELLHLWQSSRKEKQLFGNDMRGRSLHSMIKKVKVGAMAVQKILSTCFKYTIHIKNRQSFHHNITATILIGCILWMLLNALLPLLGFLLYCIFNH